MPEPYNYLANIPNPAAQITGGLTTGMGLAQTAQQMGIAREQADMMAQYRAAQIQQEEAQTAKIRYDMQQQQAREAAVTKLMENPNRTAADYEAVLAHLPKDRVDAMLAGFNAKTAEEQRADIKSGIESLAAVRSGDMQTYKDLIGKQITAAENAGDTARVNALLQAAKLSPEQIEVTIGTQLAALGPQGQQALDNLAKVQSQRLARAEEPLKIQKLAGEAQEAEAKGKLTGKKMEADIAQSKAAAQSSLASAARAAEEAKTERESRKAKVDGLVAEAQLKSANAREAVVKAATSEEKRVAEIDLLKANAEEKRAKSKMANFKPATKAFESATSALDTTTGMLETVAKLEKLINAPGVTGGTVLDRITGPVASRLPSFKAESRDVDALLSQLTAQTFLEKIPTMRGTGPISNTEGERLAAAAGNLTLNQSPKQFRETLAAMRKHAEKIQSEAQQTVTRYNQEYGEAPGAGGSSTAGMSDEAIMKALGL